MQADLFTPHGSFRDPTPESQQRHMPLAGRMRPESLEEVAGQSHLLAPGKLLRRARSRAERVLQTGRPLQMEKLNAYQRRLVHNELAKMPGIHTESEDTDSRFKRITISRA